MTTTMTAGRMSSGAAVTPAAYSPVGLVIAAVIVLAGGAAMAAVDGPITTSLLPGLGLLWAAGHLAHT